MNLDICKKCLKCSDDSKVKLGDVYDYFKKNPIVCLHFSCEDKKHKWIKVCLETNLNLDKFDKEIFQNNLVNSEVIWCKKGYKQSKHWNLNTNPCPYYIEHIISNWNNEK